MYGIEEDADIASSWLSEERRLQFVNYDGLLAELRMEDQQFFFNVPKMLCLVHCLLRWHILKAVFIG